MTSHPVGCKQLTLDVAQTVRDLHLGKGLCGLETAKTLQNPHLCVPSPTSHAEDERPPAQTTGGYHSRTFSGTCTYPAEGDAILLQDDGRDKCHLVPQEGIAAL